MSASQHHANQSAMRPPMLRSVFNHALLVLLMFSFYTQQVLAFSLYERDNLGNDAPFQINSSSHHYSPFLREDLPPQDFFTAIEMEVEEDEDFSTASEGFQPTGAIQSFSFEYVFESLIKTKYLQLCSNIEQQSAFPLFIMHHSWKGNIS